MYLQQIGFRFSGSLTFLTSVCICFLSILAACSSGGPEDRSDKTPPVLSVDQLPSGVISNVFQINWQTVEDNPANIEIFLSHDAGQNYDLLATLPNQDNHGSYAFDTTLQVDHTSYKLKIVATDIPNNKSSLESEIFEIKNNATQGSFSIALNTPTSTDIVSGTTDITWATSGVSLGTIDIKLSDQGSTDFPIVIASGIDDTGSYSWDSSSYNGNNYFIRLTVTGPGGQQEYSTPRQLVIDNSAPQLPENPYLTFSNPKTDGFTVNWNAATDLDDQLSYELFYSSSDNIRTVNEINSNGIQFNYTDTSPLTASVYAVANARKLFWNIRVTDWSGFQSSFISNTPTGIYDLDFNNLGYLTYSEPNAGLQANFVVEDSNKNIYVVGTGLYSRNQLAVWRLTPNGQFDTGFNSTGYLTLPNPEVADSDIFATAAVLDANNKLLVVGYGVGVANNFDMYLWRINPDGSLDTQNFNAPLGYTTYDHAGESEYGYSIAIDSLGNILVAGSVYDTTNNYDLLLMRYTSTGKLDASFNGTGVITHNNAVGNNSASYDEVYSIVLDANDNIVAAGRSGNSMAIWRYTNSGALDSSFGQQKLGYVTHGNTAGGGGKDMGKGVCLDGNGNILVTGSSNSSRSIADTDMVIWRYTSLGTLDSTFGPSHSGYVTHHAAATLSLSDAYPDAASVSSIEFLDEGRSIAVDSKNRIVVAGKSETIDIPSGSGTQGRMAIWRYQADGTPDYSFAGKGFLSKLPTVNPSNTFAANSVVVDRDNNDTILITGATGISYNLYLMRFQ